MCENLRGRGAVMVWGERGRGRPLRRSWDIVTVNKQGQNLNITTPLKCSAEIRKKFKIGLLRLKARHI